MFIDTKVEPLKIIIMEMAETRKSYLIKTILNMIHEIVRIETSVLVLTLIGIAVFQRSDPNPVNPDIR